MNKPELFWQTYLNLEKETLEVSKYIFFTDEIIVNEKGKETKKSCETQLTTFSPYIADLLIRCCVQIEAISKELYFNIGGTKQRGDKRVFFDYDCLKLINQKWETDNKEVLVVSPLFNFTKKENQVLCPLNNAHIKDGQKWKEAYQAVKHDRYSNLDKGNVEVLLHALAALYLLNVYYRNDSWKMQYMDIDKIDYSLGSSIFAVRPPKLEELWYGNNPVKSESPFVVKYTDEAYKRIEQTQNEENIAVQECFFSQPEFQDKNFVSEFVELISQDNSKSNYITFYSFLLKYRMKKRIHEDLPFETRKKLLLESDEWKSKINQANGHLSPDQITEETIQSEIERIGMRAGIALLRKTQKLDWTPYAMGKALCEIYIE